MQRLSPKPLRSRWLASADLASIAALLLLGASTLRLAAQQSADFNSQSAAAFTHYMIPASAGYGAPSYTFPTNPAGPGNYAYRILQPPIANDPGNYLNPRAGSVWESADAIYGAQGGTPDLLGRFCVGIDLLNWNGIWKNQVLGMGWYMQDGGFMGSRTILGGWGPTLSTLAIATLNGISYGILGNTKQGTTELDPTHQYRLVASSHEGLNHLLQVFDKAQPNTPWQSAIAYDAGYSFWGYPGYCGVLVANIMPPPPNGPNSTAGGDATFDNYYAYLPAPDATPASLPPTVTDTYPPPAGKASEFNPTVLVGIMDRDYNVVRSSIHLYLDGVQLPDGSLTIDNGSGGNGQGLHKFNLEAPVDFAGVTVTCQIPTRLPVLTLHTNTVVFQSDGQGIWYTNSWAWTAAWPYLWASNSLPLGSLSVPGFSARMVQSADANLGTILNGLLDTVHSAQLVLGYNYIVDRAATNWVQTVAWGLSANENGAITNFPGLCISPANSFAMQAQAYLQLAAGTNRFHVASDDCVGIYSGTNVTDTSIVLFQSPPVTAVDTDFDVMVEAAGLYPVNIIYEQGSGGAHLVLSSVNLIGNTRTLVNISGGVPAFYPPPSWTCMSSSSVKGAYNTPVATLMTTNIATVTTASVLCGGSGAPLNLAVTGWSGTNTVTLTPAGSPMFYRLYGPGSTQILGYKKSGSNLVITYRCQTP